MKNNHTPEIRFSGFTGNWVEYKFGDMYDVVSGYAFKMSDYVQGGVPIINGESIQHGSISTKNLNFLPEGFSDKYQNFILDTGDIVLGLNRPITNGKLKIAQVPKDLHGALLYQRAGKIIIINNSNINFSYQLLGNEVPKFVLKEAVGSDQPFISTTKLKKWLICIPALEEEQSKIGNFLKQLDDTIALHQQELTTLKQTKQGFLQKMFPKEGESVPKVRFPGFTGDWEERKLGEILKVNSGRDYKHLQQGNIPVYGTGGYMLSVNDKLSDEDAIGIGRKGTIDNPQLLKAPFWTVDTLFYMTTKEKNDLLFCYSLANKIHWKKYDESTGVPSLSKSSIDKIFISIPTPAEQSKIGNFFKRLDDTISLHQRELDALNQTKKAFLQKMFA
ncbi:restriction endonuclease subunit S [Bacillus toyonensis]|uniref:restriction endonuclease subunit S n=1 Tax=Bacillus toyonensis TaxID=155322 RepID=UPI00292A5313|nr:restriction endonuclease subunit S [Bacillus toyonensis]